MKDSILWAHSDSALGMDLSSFLSFLMSLDTYLLSIPKVLAISPGLTGLPAFFMASNTLSLFTVFTFFHIF